MESLRTLENNLFIFIENLHGLSKERLCNAYHLLAISPSCEYSTYQLQLTGPLGTYAEYMLVFRYICRVYVGV